MHFTRSVAYVASSSAPLALRYEIAIVRPLAKERGTIGSRHAGIWEIYLHTWLLHGSALFGWPVTLTLRGQIGSGALYSSRGCNTGCLSITVSILQVTVLVRMATSR
jgi:hypothetical protein